MSRLNGASGYIDTLAYAHWPGAPHLPVSASQQLVFVPSNESYPAYTGPRATPGPIPGAWPGEEPGDRASLNQKIKNSEDYWQAGDVWFAGAEIDGVAAPAPGSEYDEYFSYFAKVAPAINTLIAGQDAEEKAAIIRSKIIFYEGMLAKANNTMVKGLIQQQINKLSSQLAAVDDAAFAIRSTRQASLAGKYILLGVGGLGLILMLQASLYLKKKTANL